MNKNSETRVRAVFLDVGGTLAYPHPSFHGLIAQVCQSNGLPVRPEDAERAEGVAGLSLWTVVAWAADGLPAAAASAEAVVEGANASVDAGGDDDGVADFGSD